MYIIYIGLYGSATIFICTYLVHYIPKLLIYEVYSFLLHTCYIYIVFINVVELLELILKNYFDHNARNAYK